MTRAARRCHRLNYPKKEIKNEIVMEKLSKVEPKLRTSIYETPYDFSVEVYDESSTHIIFRCLCSKERYSLYEVHVLLSKVLI